VDHGGRGSLGIRNTDTSPLMSLFLSLYGQGGSVVPPVSPAKPSPIRPGQARPKSRNGFLARPEGVTAI
jgi:hypothetical protein